MGNRLLLLISCLCLISLAVAQEQAPPLPQPSPGVNLALGKACTFDPAPNYGECTEAGDATDLTDGVHNGCEWRDQGTVGWGVGRTSSFTVDVDLGSAQPIGKITFDSVTGAAQVTFPSAALAFVSSDGKEYRYLGDVLTESLPQDKFVNHRFALEGLKGWGRYVRLVILPGGFYVFCDEIEVMKGDHTAAQAAWADDKPIAADQVAAYALDLKSWVNQKNATLALLRYATEGAQERLALGTKAASGEGVTKVVAQARQEVLQTKTVQEADYWQGPPYRSFDQAAFAAVGAMNAARWPGAPARLWQDTGWTWLKPLAAPQGPAPQVRVDMMGNEWACASFNVTSCLGKPQDLTLQVADFSGPQKLPTAQVLSVGQIIHTEAFGYNYRDDAIVPLTPNPSPNGGGETLPLPAGLSKRFWLTFKTRGMDLKPGVYSSTITVSSGGKQLGRVPLRLRISPVRFPDQVTCQSNTWGYYYEQAIAGRELEASQNLRDHYNTALDINHSYLPYPKPDAQGNFTAPLDFTKLDQMIDWYPDCRLWLLWAGFEFGFDRLGTPRYGGPVWEKVFEQWVTQIRDHLATRGIGRDRFAWYWIDEPGEKAWNERCLPTSQLLKRIDPQMLTWENPTESVTPQMLEEALPYFDMYCPSIGEVGSTARVAVCNRTKLPSWVYACASEKNANPGAYYRWLAWKAFQLGFGGLGMWVYVDANCATPSDYTSGVSYAMIYGWPMRSERAPRIVNSKRWEAWREGIADWERLRMLREAAQRARQAGTKTEAVARAEELLTKGVAEVVGESPYGGDVTRPELADQMRLRILECLEKLQ